LRRFRKTDSVVAEVTSGGRLFQRWLPATGNARSPTVDSRVRRITSCEDDDDRRRRQLETATLDLLHILQFVHFLSSFTIFVHCPGEIQFLPHAKKQTLLRSKLIKPILFSDYTDVHIQQTSTVSFVSFVRVPLNRVHQSRYLLSVVTACSSFSPWQIVPELDGVCHWYPYHAPLHPD